MVIIIITADRAAHSACANRMVCAQARYRPTHVYALALAQQQRAEVRLACQ